MGTFSHKEISSLIDSHELFLTQINLHRSGMNRITYNVVASTQAGEYIRAQEGHHNADCDSMITISLCYGKQTMVSEDRGNQQSATADGVAGDAYDTKVLLNDIEQPKHLLDYDLGLRDSGQDWHSPLLTIATLRWDYKVWCLNHLEDEPIWTVYWIYVLEFSDKW